MKRLRELSESDEPEGDDIVSVGTKATRLIRAVQGFQKTGGRRYLTRAEVARLLEVSPGSISRWAREGKLPFTRTIGGRRRYPKESILRLVKEMMDAG